MLDRRRLALGRELHDDVAEGLGEGRELRLHDRCHDAVVNVTCRESTTKIQIGEEEEVKVIVD